MCERETSVVVYLPRKATENRSSVSHKHCWLCVRVAFPERITLCLFHAHARGLAGNEAIYKFILLYTPQWVRVISGHGSESITESQFATGLQPAESDY